MTPSATSPLARPRDTKGPKVWLDYDQAGLDDAYDQTVWTPLMADLQARRAATSEAARARIGQPQRFAYGPAPVEGLDVFPARAPHAPVFVFIHGGGWRQGDAKGYAFAAEMFRDAGVAYVVPDFAPVTDSAATSCRWRRRCAAPSPSPTRTPCSSAATPRASTSRAIPPARISPRWR